MVLTALRGGLGFLSRLPIGRDEQAWNAFRRTPLAFVLGGYVLGLLLAPALAIPLPAPTAALVFVAWLYLLTGITHLDGLADLGDALVVHGDSARREDVMQDTVVGVGGVLAIVVAVAGLVTAGVGIARLAAVAVPIVIAAEVSAKLGMALLACLGRAAHDGFGEAVCGGLAPRDALVPALAALPAGLVTWPHPAGALALLSGLLPAALLWWWAARRVGGLTGDVLGASNELSRLVALHAGVIAWTRL